MKIIPLFFIAGLSALTLATVATSQSLRSDANRPTDLIAPDLGVSESTFIECFGDVLPARNFAPSGQRKRENKAKLLPCLQTANPSISNALLDAVMDRYRPEGRNG